MDRNLPHQQNQGALPLPVVVMLSVVNTVEALTILAPSVLRLLSLELQRRVYVVSDDSPSPANR